MFWAPCDIFFILCFEQLEEGIALVLEAAREALDLIPGGQDGHVKYGLHFFWVGLNASFTDHEA